MNQADMFPSKLDRYVGIRNRSCVWYFDRTRNVGLLSRRKAKGDVNWGNEEREEASNVDRERTCERGVALWE